MSPIPVVIVTFRNPDDAVECLGSLSRAIQDPAFDVYLCENGGDEAFAALCAAISSPQGPCVPIADHPPCSTDGFVAVTAFALCEGGARVFAGEAGENLGYGGGVNRWLKPLMESGGWPGLLLLNPDTVVEPDALGALARYAEAHGKTMVTGRIVLAECSTELHTRGLRWRPLLASPVGVGRREPVDSRPPEDIERQIDAPAGSFVYATRACLDTIGPMEDRYFLFMEDLDWGMRAKRTGALGYAFDAVVWHKGGTTIGSGIGTKSEFATYLSFRNRVLFVWWNFPVWLPWTVVVTFARALEVGVRGQPSNMRAALRGLRDVDSWGVPAALMKPSRDIWPTGWRSEVDPVFGTGG